MFYIVKITDFWVIHYLSIIGSITVKSFRQIVRKIWNLLIPYLRLLRGIFRRYLLVPSRRLFGPSIPIVMITGTKGKTTTTRMLSHILSKAGHRVGFTSTDGIVINGEYIDRNDCAHYDGAHIVLTDRSITAAVLETARGGLLKLGLYIDRCNVAALLNVGREQIGIDGIETVEQMAALKQRVINAARDAVVLNADDVQCSKMIGQYPTDRVILFSLEEDNQFVENHIEQGGIAYILNSSVEGECIERWDKKAKVPVISITDLPSSGNGLFPQNIANALAAAALADGMSIPMKTVKAALYSFENSLEHSPGHLNFLEGYSQTILLDTVATVPSSTALVSSLNRMNVSGRRVCMYTTAGNRPDWHYTELGEIFGPHFDHFICYELEKYARGRNPGEISELLKAGLVLAGVSSDLIDTAQGYIEATRQLSKVVGQNDLVVILMASAHNYIPVFLENFSAHKIKE